MTIAWDPVDPIITAQRVGYLAELIFVLEGSRTKTGVQQVFKRKLWSIDQKIPGEILSGDWSPDDEMPKKLMEWAYGTMGQGAT